MWVTDVSRKFCSPVLEVWIVQWIWQSLWTIYFTIFQCLPVRNDFSGSLNFPLASGRKCYQVRISDCRLCSNILQNFQKALSQLYASRHPKFCITHKPDLIDQTLHFTKLGICDFEERMTSIYSRFSSFPSVTMRDHALYLFSKAAIIQIWRKILNLIRGMRHEVSMNSVSEKPLSLTQTTQDILIH